jgi:hypothetical protein
MFQLENSWTDFNEIQYGYSTIGSYPRVTLFNFLQPVMPTWWTHGLVRWE